MTRREFLSLAGTGAAALTLSAAPGCRTALRPEAEARVMTVRGAVRPPELGLTLSHEHVLVDFIGAEAVSRDRYNPDAAFAKILPYLRQIQTLGCRTLIECTPAFIGRDPFLLRRLSEASGLHLLTNTGYYGAADNKFLPKHAYAESADELAERWVREFHDGIEGTGIHPGFIKIGVGGERLSPVHEKLVRAAARTHQATGLVIASHTGPSRLAMEQLDVLRSEGVAPRAFIWVHAQAEPDLAKCQSVAERGCWVSFDGFAEKDLNRYLEVTRVFRNAGRLDRLLISHDAGWYRPGEPNGGEFRPFNELLRVFIPAALKGGLGQQVVDQVFVTNPGRAFRIECRLE